MKEVKVFEQARRNVRILSGAATLEGELSVPANAQGIVLFAHGSGSSRHSPRNQYVARIIREARVGTLLFDLLTDRKSTRLNSSHLGISYAVFCLKKKK